MLATATALTAARFWDYVSAWRAAQGTLHEATFAPDGAWSDDSSRSDLGNVGERDGDTLTAAHGALAELIEAHEASTVAELAAKIEVARAGVYGARPLRLTDREAALLRQGLAEIVDGLEPVPGGAAEIAAGEDEPARFAVTDAGAALLRALAGECARPSA